jgi:hypothetical protein
VKGTPESRRAASAVARVRLDSPRPWRYGARKKGPSGTVDLVFAVIGVVFFILEWIYHTLEKIPLYGWFFVFGMWVLFKLGLMLESGFGTVLQRFRDIDARLGEIQTQLSRLAGDISDLSSDEDYDDDSP